MLNKKAELDKIRNEQIKLLMDVLNYTQEEARESVENELSEHDEYYLPDPEGDRIVDFDSDWAVPLEEIDNFFDTEAGDRLDELDRDNLECQLFTLASPPVTDASLARVRELAAKYSGYGSREGSVTDGSGFERAFLVNAETGDVIPNTK